jgi:hypothetical protein
MLFAPTTGNFAVGQQQQEKQSFIKYDLNKNGSMDFQVVIALL